MTFGIHRKMVSAADSFSGLPEKLLARDDLHLLVFA